jgi:hypothetical protein
MSMFFIVSFFLTSTKGAIGSPSFEDVFAAPLSQRLAGERVHADLGGLRRAAPPWLAISL